MGPIEADAQFCHMCGAPTEIDDRFCSSCGAALLRPESAEPGTVLPPAPLDPAQSAATAPPVGQGSGPSPRRRVLVLLAAALLVIAAGVGVVLLARSDGDGDFADSSDEGGLDDESQGGVVDYTDDPNVRGNLIANMRGCEILRYTNNNEFDLNIRYTARFVDGNGLILLEETENFTSPARTTVQIDFGRFPPGTQNCPGDTERIAETV